MQTLFETKTYKIEGSILGVIIRHKQAHTKAMIAADMARDFMEYYETNLHIIPPSAVPAAMDELCSLYFIKPKVQLSPNVQPMVA